MSENSSPLTTPTINDGDDINTPRGRPRRGRPPLSATRSTRSSPAAPSENDGVSSTTSTVISNPGDHLEEDNPLPDYLLRTIGRLELLSLNDVVEESNEAGDGGDSDAEGNDACDHDVALTTSVLDWMSLLEEMAVVEDAINNSVVLASAGRLSTALATKTA